MEYKRNLLPKMAVDRLNENPEAVLIDVRTSAEHKYVGFPENSILIPWFDEPDLNSDPSAFCKAVNNQLSDRSDILGTELILICRSGFRSNEALKCLQNNGFTCVSHVASGFEGDLDENDHRGNLNGWRNDGMPWSQG
ncbi:rhodanese-like domain-containing protein [Candidatus Pseudothioglobus singularis]|jgi:rhodanese-related sulfurtransferase|nr:rhodanese-like domain-containing protein [Candidatus Pseudothioglobus singularis]